MNICDNSIITFGRIYLIFSNTSQVDSYYRYRKPVMRNNLKHTEEHYNYKKYGIKHEVCKAVYLSTGYGLSYDTFLSFYIQ